MGYDGSSLRTDRKIFEIELFESSFLGLSKISPSLTVDRRITIGSTLYTLLM